MGRQVKRVSLSFDWPLRQVWRGYVNPHAERATRCSACGGTGYSPEAKRIADQWYGYVPFDPASTGSKPHGPDHPKVRALAERNVDAGRYAGSVSREYLVRREAERLSGMWDGQWCHHLAQADVDALVAADRLWDFTRRPRTEEQRRALGTGCWMDEPNGHRPTAAEVNEWSLAGFGHDAINRGVCVEARCRREGLPYRCAFCEGDGEVWPSPEVKAASEAWEPEEPPVGEGWQMWETTSEGSPISPVFATPEELARWLADTGASTFGRETATYGQWLGMIRADWAPSAVADAKGVRSGVEAVADPVS